MIACNSCAEGRRAKSDSYWRIQFWVGQLQRINLEWDTATDSRRTKLDEERGRARRQIERLCLTYMQSIAKIHRSTWNYSVGPMVDRLMNSPNEWSDILNREDRNFQ